MASGNQLQAELEKLAIQLSPQTAAFLKSVAAPMLATLGTLGTVGVAKYMMARGDEKAHLQAAQEGYDKTFARSPLFQQNPGHFNERYRELYTISPTIAKNPQLATKLIKDRLEKGFTVDDLHRLSTIEYHASNTIKGPDASAVGRAAALGALEGTLSTLEPLIAKEMDARIKAKAQLALDSKAKLEQELTKSIKRVGVSDAMIQKATQLNLGDKATHNAFVNEATSEAMRSPVIQQIQNDAVAQAIARREARLEAQRSGMEKKSSALTVSDECMAVMLADRYVMAKTAGVLDVMGQGAKALGGNLAFMAPALALGAGTILAQSIMSNMRESELSGRADAVFADLKKNNEKVSANPQISREAFDAIKSFAPDLAAKPNVLRTFLEHAVDTEGRMPIENIKQMAETQNIVAKKAPDGGFISGLKAPMSLLGLKVPGNVSGGERSGSGFLSKLKKRTRS